jgi:hypothetical protein
MKNKLHIFLIFFYFKNLFSQISLEPRTDLEYYQTTLFEYIYKNINKEELKKYTISDVTNQKSNTLNFFQACALLLFSLSNKKHDKYVLWALERLYALSSDAKLNELILWNLACEYEKYEKFRIASELFYQFKKIFPGSSFYWSARLREITTAYNFCQDEYHDIYDTEKTMRLAQEYINDAYELNQELTIDIVYILQDLSLRMIKKTVDIGTHYLKKNKYTYNSVCILSAIQRLDELLSDIKYFLNFNIETLSSDKKHTQYIATLREIEKQASLFFNKNDSITLPSGFNYQEEHREITQYINTYKNNIITQLDEIYKKIDYSIEIYYEI